MRVNVPRFPGSWMPSSARTRVAVDATPPRASMPSSGGVASSATTSTRSTDCSPAAFLSTCSGARTIRRARIPRGVSASSPRKTTRASSTPPSAYISSSIPAPATTTDPLASLCALLLTSLAKCFTVALSVLVTRSSSPGSRAGIPTRRALPPPPRAAPPTPTRLVTLANEDVLAVVEDTARTAPRHAITPWDMVSVRRRVCPRRGGAGEEGVVICRKKKRRRRQLVTATADPVSFRAAPPPPSPSPLWATRAPRRVSLGADPG